MANTLKGTIEEVNSAEAAKNPGMGMYFLLRQIDEPILLQDVYSVNQAARLLHISPDRLRSFAKRDNNPFPLRYFKNGARGSFVLRDEFIGWLKSETVSAVDMARERKRAKYSAQES